MPKLILHTGAAKTGTSALQLFFESNASWLAQHGIRYPAGSHRPDPITKISSGNGGWLYGFLDTGRYWEEFVGQLNVAGSTSDVLISSELLAKVRADRICEVRDRLTALGFELRPFYLVRNPDEWYLSAYQQNVKRHGYAKTFSDFCAERVLEFDIALTNYDQALGQGALRVLSYEAGKDDIVAYVLRHGLGIDAPAPPHENPQINRSLTRYELEALRAANSAQHAAGIDLETVGARGQRISDRLIAARPHIPRTAKYREPMPEDAVDRLRPSVEALNARLAEGEIGFPVSAASPSLDESQAESAHMLVLLLLQQCELLEAHDRLLETQQHTVGALRADLAAAPQHQQDLAGELVALRNSTSWRVTEPLRRITGALKGQGSRRR